MVVAYVPEMKIRSGNLIKNLYKEHSWRNAMLYYLQGPTGQDRILILLSHRPSSRLNKFSEMGKKVIVKMLTA